MNWDGKSVLVTGAGGFIGSHLTETLVQRGASVKAMVRYNSANSHGWLNVSKYHDAIEFISGDICDKNLVQKAMEGCDVVLHLAALIAIPYSYDAPESYVHSNVEGTLTVLQAGRDAGVSRIVHTSTSEVYGTAQYVPIDEAHPLNAQSPYAATKIAADQLALSFQRSFGTPVTVLRPFNTYGPRQSARAVLPSVISQILAGNTKVSMGALDPTRDFNFVSDTVAAFLAVASAPEENVVGDIFNAGTGWEISIGDAVKVIADVTGRDIEIVQKNDRIRPEKSEVERLMAQADKIKTATDWLPIYVGKNGFARGIKETVSWFKEGQNLSQYRTDRNVV